MQVYIKQPKEIFHSAEMSLGYSAHLYNQDNMGILLSRASNEKECLIQSLVEIDEVRNQILGMLNVQD